MLVDLNSRRRRPITRITRKLWAHVPAPAPEIPQPPPDVVPLPVPPVSPSHPPEIIDPPPLGGYPQVRDPLVRPMLSARAW